MAFGGAGERALLVAEQNRLDEIFRHRAAIDRDEGFGPPLARAMNGARDQFLADARFTGDEHGDVRGGGLLRHAQHAVHGRALGDDVFEAERTRAAVLDAVDLAFERAGVERVAQAHLHALGADRLDHEIDRAGPHRGDDIVDAAMRGLHDHRHVDCRLAHFRQHAHAVEVRHHQIEDHAIEAPAIGPGEHRQRRIAVIARHRFVAEFLQHAFEQPALHRIVVDDEDSHRYLG